MTVLEATREPAAYRAYHGLRESGHRFLPGARVPQLFGFVVAQILQGLLLREVRSFFALVEAETLGMANSVRPRLRLPTLSAPSLPRMRIM